MYSVYFLDSAGVKQAYTLSACPPICTETHVACTPATVSDLCNKHSFSLSCYFSRWNATCEKCV